MRHQTRREFIKRTTAGATGLAVLPWAPLSAQAASQKGKPIPAHREMALTGVHAYPDLESVAAGETISFHASTSVPTRLSICRLGPEVDNPSGDKVLQEFPERMPKPQMIHPGSYIHVERRLTKMPAAMTLECWVRPWTFGRWQDVITQMSFREQCDFALAIGPEGEVAFYLGDGRSFRDAWALASIKSTLKIGQWHHLVASWDGQTRMLWVDGQEFARTAEERSPREASWGQPLRLGAGGTDGAADDFFDGDLAMPSIYGRGLDERAVRERFYQKGLETASGGQVLACWPLDEEGGMQVRDDSHHHRHGRLINHGTWMIGGPGFDANVERFGAYAPKEDLQRGHGLRFASDDLYDCRWTATHSWHVPPGARPGLHVARFQFELEGKPHLYDVTFNVRRAIRRSRAKGRVLVLCASNTWRAYSGTPFAANTPELKQVWGTGGGVEAANKPPAFNLYRAHRAGQGTYQVGLRMPWPAAGPYILYGGPTNYSHLMRAERFLHVWLEQNGYETDYILDSDLHRHPEALRGYSAVVINGHSEYWSVPMLRGLEGYLKRQGNVVVFSGNSLFWRVSFNEEGSIMECRKVDAAGNQVPAARRGECWHSQDGQRGGLLRECGHPGWKLIGLETLGFNNPGKAENYGPYVAEGVDHFLFHKPEETGLKAGDKFGWAGEGKVPMANGHEFDVRVSTLAALQQQLPPPGASHPSDPPGILRLANGIIPWKEGGVAFDYFFRSIKPKSDQGAEMIYWERPEGGRVFNAGSIGAGWALSADETLQKLLRNVLHAFGVRPRR